MRTKHGSEEERSLVLDGLTGLSQSNLAGRLEQWRGSNKALDG